VADRLQQGAHGGQVGLLVGDAGLHRVAAVVEEDLQGHVVAETPHEERSQMLVVVDEAGGDEPAAGVDGADRLPVAGRLHIGGGAHRLDLAAVHGQRPVAHHAALGVHGDEPVGVANQQVDHYVSLLNS